MAHGTAAVNFLWAPVFVKHCNGFPVWIAIHGVTCKVKTSPRWWWWGGPPTCARDPSQWTFMSCSRRWQANSMPIVRPNDARIELWRRTLIAPAIDTATLPRKEIAQLLSFDSCCCCVCIPLSLTVKRHLPWWWARVFCLQWACSFYQQPASSVRFDIINDQTLVLSWHLSIVQPTCTRCTCMCMCLPRFL